MALLRPGAGQFPRPPGIPRLNPADPLAQGLAGCWMFDAGLYDVTGNGNNGSFVGANCYWDAAGHCDGGVALGFTNSYDSYVSIASPPWHTATKLTLCGWAYPLSFYGGAYQDIITSGYDGSTVQMAIGILGGAWFVGSYNSGWTQFSGPAPALNTLAFVCGTADGSNLILYINGKKVASASIGNLPAGNTSAWRIGTKHDATGVDLTWYGSLDNIRVYTRALSPGEVLALYQNPGAGFVWPRDRGVASFKGASGGAPLVIDRPLPMEWLAVSPGVDKITPFEMLAGTGRDGAVPIENLARAVVNIDFHDEALAALNADRTIESEFLQTRLFTSDSLGDEWLITALRGQPLVNEWLGVIHSDSVAKLELAATLLQYAGVSGEITGSARGDSSLLDEWTGSLTALLAGAGIPIEVSGSIAVAGVGVATEIIAKALADIRSPAEFLSFVRHDETTRAEFLAGLLVRDDAVAFELLALLPSLHQLPIEWSALPAMLRVSLERLLASPSKRRILWTPGRFRLLKRQ